MNGGGERLLRDLIFFASFLGLKRVSTVISQSFARRMAISRDGSYIDFLMADGGNATIENVSKLSQGYYAV